MLANFHKKKSGNHRRRRIIIRCLFGIVKYVMPLTAGVTAMAFADPQTVTINAVAQTMPRTGSGTNSGSFATNDGTVKLSVSHAYGKRNRRTIRINHSKIAADPLLSENVEFSMSSYLVVDVPPRGYTVTEAKQVVDGLVAYLAASTGANITKLLGGES
jgi:hypothetical protein